VVAILLGPSFLVGLRRGCFSSPSCEYAPYLAVIAQVGVVLYMFLVGLDLDTDLLQKRTQAAIAISHASIVLPFLLGAAFALWLYPLYSTGVFSFTTFALFIGVAMSITAFPVLARILTDRGMQKTRLGVLALACAAIDDTESGVPLLAYAPSADRNFVHFDYDDWVLLRVADCQERCSVARAAADCERQNDAGHVRHSLRCLASVGIGDRANWNSCAVRRFPSRNRDSAQFCVGARYSGEV
jgi:Kef-type K+ transport system membrane component KefB